MAAVTRDEVYADFNPNTDIRVFKIGVDENDALVYTLSTVNLQEISKQYFALSYCWGAERMTVKVNGYGVKISKNLVDFTRTLWDEYASKHPYWHFLWADAVCINQANNEERAEQVRRMRYIYEEAKSVYAWLGPETESTPLARALVDKILTHHDARVQEVGLCEALLNIDVRCKGLLDYKKGDHILDDRSESADALYQFLSHSWWSRAWIMQEGTLDKVTGLLWGKELQDRGDMFVIASYAKEIFEELNYQWVKGHNCPERYEVLAMRRMLHMIFSVNVFPGTRSVALQHKLPTGALLVIEQLRKKDASDARDKVYAALCLLNKESSDAFVIDYDLPIGEVYREFARRLVFSTDPPNLDVLGICVPDEDGTSKLSLPSWVPDHTIYSRRTQFHKSLGPDHGPTYSADKGIRDLVAFGQQSVYISNDDTLHVRGVFVDTIVARSSRGSIRHEFQMTYDWLPDGHKDDIYFTNEPMDVVYRRTLVADLEECDERTKGYMRRGFELDWNVYARERETSRYFSMVTRLAQTQDERRLLSTRKGYFGIGPNSLQEGDELYILLGGQVIYALRATLSPKHYRFVGECYIHGLMDGDFGPVKLHDIQDIKLL